MSSLLLGFVAGMCLLTTAFAQKAWEKKPYAEWSMSEVMHILTDSPWAQTQFENEPCTSKVLARIIQVRCGALV